MRTKHLSFLLLASPVLCYGADCDQYTGSKPSTKAFEEVFEAYNKIGQKTEFETTNQYQERKNIAIRSIAPAPTIIRKEVEEKKYLQYDADSQELRIIKYVFHNKTYVQHSLFSAAGFFPPGFDERGQRQLPAVEAVVAAKDVKTGSYNGTTRGGATIEIAKMDRNTEIIFDRPEPNTLTAKGLFPQADSSPYILGAIKASIDEAKRLKETISLAFVVSPKEPYAISGRHRPYKPTFDSPIDMHENFKVLFASISCALVLDAQGAVLASYKTAGN